MDVLLSRTVQGLMPADDESRDQLRKLKQGTVVRCEIVRPRNLAHHQKFFALLQTVWEAGIGDSVPSLLVDLKLRLRHTETHRLAQPFELFDEDGVLVLTIPAGTLFEIPKSISFASMGQDDFDQFFERALAALCEMAGGIDDHVLREAVLGRLSRA